MKFLFRVTGWERAAWWRRLLGAVGRVAAFLCLVVALLAMLGPPIGTYFLLRKMTREVPGVSVTPQPLQDYSVSSAPGMELSYFGYSFEVPWTEISKKKEVPNKLGGGVAGIEFSSGHALVIFASSDQSGFFSEMVRDKDFQGFGPAFADLTKLSPYDQYAALLNISPSAIRPFGPRAEIGRGMILLTIKAIAVPGNLETGAFSFQFPGERGFQIGEPSKSNRVQLEVLDLKGHSVEMSCRAAKNDVHFTQPEINRILSTLRVVSAGSVAVHAAGASAPRGH